MVGGMVKSDVSKQIKSLVAVCLFFLAPCFLGNMILRFFLLNHKNNKKHQQLQLGQKTYVFHGSDYLPLYVLQFLTANLSLQFSTVPQNL